ncbi:MAG: insulinase family protein [Polyangiaceae bacterium]|nr:insulinase family protein [Polyangiaceae bacterium]
MGVIVEPSQALPLVSVIVAFRSGSAHDPAGREGLARLTGRMLRRGAEGWTSEAIEETIDLLGGELGVDVSPSATLVHFEVIKRSLEPFLDIVATVLSRPVFDVGELERLKREAIAEIVESRDSDGLLCARAFRRTIFAGHPYGRRISGQIATLKEMQRDDIVKFYKTHYTQSNAHVVVSGDVDVEEGNAIAEKLLERLPVGDRIEDPVPPPKPPTGRRLIFVDKPERTQMQMVVGGLGTHPTDEDHIPLLVANTAFGGTFTSRLMQEIRAKRGLSYGTSSRLGVDRQRDSFMMWAAPKATDGALCLSLMLDLLHGVRDGGITADELSFVKKYLIRSHAFEVDTARKRAHRKLDAVLFDLPDGYYERQNELIEAVTLDEANAALRNRLSEDDMIIAVVGTHADIGKTITDAIPRLAGVEVCPFDLE